MAENPLPRDLSPKPKLNVLHMSLPDALSALIRGRKKKVKLECKFCTTPSASSSNEEQDCDECGKFVCWRCRYPTAEGFICSRCNKRAEKEKTQCKKCKEINASHGETLDDSFRESEGIDCDDCNRIGCTDCIVRVCIVAYLRKRDFESKNLCQKCREWHGV